MLAKPPYNWAGVETRSFFKLHGPFLLSMLKSMRQGSITVSELKYFLKDCMEIYCFKTSLGSTKHNIFTSYHKCFRNFTV